MKQLLMRLPKNLLGVFFLSSFLGVSLVYLSRVHAQDANGLNVTVSPAVIDLTAHPGDTIQNKFRIHNNSLTPLDVSITAKKLISDPNAGQPVPADPGPADAYISWVTFSPDKATIQPQEWQDVNYTITIPKDAAFGYYYVFQIAPKPPATFTKSGATVLPQVVIAALLNVQAPGASSQIKVTQFKPSAFVSQYLPVDFLTEVQNTGNVHVRPHGNIFIRGISPNDLAILDVNSNLGAVLPNGKRIFTASWNDGFITNAAVVVDGKAKLDGQGNPVRHLSINWNKLTDFRIGKYTASLLLVYDDGTRDQTVQTSADFWVVPYIPIAVIIIGIILLFFIFRLIIRSYIRRELKRMKNQK